MHSGEPYRLPIKSTAKRRTAGVLMALTLAAFAVVALPLLWLWATLSGAVKGAAYIVLITGETFLALIQDNWRKDT